MAGATGGRALDETPTWAVASVCAVIILISVLIEKGFDRIGKWFSSRQKNALVEALERVKLELMVLGFISLLLTFGQNYVSKVCITERLASTMLPCRRKKEEENSTMASNFTRRILAEDALDSTCSNGKVPLISLYGLHQLHIFIFFLAIFHVANSLTLALGKAKIRRWKEWEKEALSPSYKFSSDPLGSRYPQETTILKQLRTLWNTNPILMYTVSFFHQFFRSVRKTDYMTMRHGFITENLTPGTEFNFKKYINRSLEDDFKVVIGVSPILWASAVIVFLLNVTGLQILFWVSLIIPLITILVVGAKLQSIITQMAIEIELQQRVIRRVPLVELIDRKFWFGRPDFILNIIHLSIFQNLFQMVLFIWIWYGFGLKSCFHDNLTFIIIRLCLGVGVQFLCCYVTLPLYALVSQMGSSMKKSIFNDIYKQSIRRADIEAGPIEEQPCSNEIASLPPSQSGQNL